MATDMDTAPVQVYAAGSLREALTDLARAHDIAVALTFGAAGLLRERIERGEPAQVFASADLRQPKRLAEQGGWTAPVVFTRNSLCALVGPAISTSSAGLLDTLLDPTVRVGTSTPRSDPSGDYAWAMFDRAERLHEGAHARLAGKALQLTGAADSPKAPAGRSTYAWVMQEGRADVFLTYRTNALAAQAECPSLQIVALPEALHVGADYGVSCRDDAPPPARAWLGALLSGPVQRILARHGFENPCKAPPRRRDLLIAAGLGACLPAWAQGTARSVVDGANRRVSVPVQVQRIFPAGPPAAIWLYTLAPDTLIGWPRANRGPELEFLLPGVGNRPEVGRLTGRGNTTNLEQLLASRPDLIVDAGSTRQTFVELADRVQSQTGIPYALLDGRLEATAQGYTLLGELTGRTERAARLARYTADTLRTVRERVARATAQQPRVYFARGPEGLETGLGGSINVEMFEAMGIRHVAAGLQGGLATVPIEQVLAWDPEVIVTIDPTFAQSVQNNPLWRGVSAVKSGRVHLSPKLPFGWIDFPPSVNRLPGLWWLGSKVFPALFPEDLGAVTREFYQLFYQVELTPAQVQRVLAGREQ